MKSAGIEPGSIVVRSLSSMKSFSELVSSGSPAILLRFASNLIVTAFLVEAAIFSLNRDCDLA